MAGKTVTRVDLAEAVYQTISLSRTGAANLVEQVLGEICDTLVRGEPVKLPGFGKFVVRSKVERVGRNPKTGVEMPIKPHRALMFKPSNQLKAYMNGEAAEGED